ncbi:uncharacterized protein LOC105197971 [Solenopsis invicta]|uniref:uncharacterized protein LOC105197971 n=1 Tax=Solenopsis invicta TaxID=13686 RepID=UPI00193E87EF|nr:uncharacterized protein LOC105197971 [Solenopsis invicta]
MKEYNSSKMSQTSCNLNVMEELTQTVQSFWQVEGYKPKDLTPEEEYCENLFNENYRRQEGGRFIVKLPIKEEILPSLTNSREIDFKRFIAIERKFAKLPEFKKEYVTFMREYYQLGHMKLAQSIQDDKIRVFLSHHAVIKQSSTTTKTRVVFDASSPYSQGNSLNDALHKGPVIQADLFSLIIQFRCYRYVLCADIKKMYRQILINEKQTALQTILWREDPKDEIQEYELLTVTYGTKPASFLAVRCLHKLAEIERVNYPTAAEVVLNNFYMDDLLAGGYTKAEVLKLKQELTELLAKGGYSLHKWKTNLVSENENTRNENVDITKEVESRLLDVLWNPLKDTFQYEILQTKDDQRVTKRAVLSQICKLFDPLGLVGPVITSAKIIMQGLWSLGIEWDESVPMHIYKSWEQIKTQLGLLNKLQIPRLIVSGNNESQLQLHGFCDLSEKAYGACVYIREKNMQGNSSVTLICSKSRVAPMKTLSLPRL